MSGLPRNLQNCFGVCSPVLSPVPPAGKKKVPGSAGPLALTGGYHSDLVRARASVLALQLDALGAGFVVDTPPVRPPTAAAAPLGPQPASRGPSNPVGQELSGETLARTHQLPDGFEAGAVAVRDVLCGPQLPAADLAFVCGDKNG
uniref:Uncharacterized protein n=1 Tax=Periophthalmus magnuspinnatus TaxID=409849 RepID=A0A3B4BLJ5_9GOBI